MMAGEGSDPSGNVSSAISSGQQRLLSLLQEVVVKGFVDRMNLDENADKLTKGMRKLMDNKADVLVKVQNEEKDPWTKRTFEVVGWVKSVDELDTKVSAFEERNRSRSSCFEPVCVNCDLAIEAVKLLNEVDTLQRERERVVLNLVHRHTPNPVAAPPMPEIKVLGVEMILTKIIDHVRDKNIKTIGIYGMGGVGKTTLLAEIYHFFNKQDSRDFELIIWLTLSHNLNVFAIQEEIGVRLGFARQGEGQLPTHEIDRRNMLSCALGFKKFLLLLDNVWTDKKVLNDVGIPMDNPDQGKIVFTTRPKTICDDMYAEAIELGILDKQNSENLFFLHAGKSIDQIKIKPYAKSIIDGCGGLPLALVTAGKTMKGKRNVQDWKDAENKFKRMPKEVFRSLKFSFDKLTDDSKQGLLYCSLFPKDKYIEEKQLIEYWVGEGKDFLKSDSVDDARTRGRDIIKKLTDACLLERGGIGYEDSHIKMHALIREMVFFLPEIEPDKNNVLFVSAGTGDSENQNKRNAKIPWEDAKRISLIGNKNVTLPSTPPACDRLSTLLMKGTNVEQLVLGGMSAFFFMPNLRVLDLSDTNIDALPEDIDSLTWLQYLNLSGTKIKTLPIKLGNLSQLRHLNLCGANQLKKIPNEAILNLKSLQILNIFKIGCDLIWESSENTNQESDDYKLNLCDLERSLEKLVELEIGIGPNQAVLEGLVGSGRLCKCLTFLELRKVSGLTTAFLCKAFKRLKKLRGLNIIDCSDLKELRFESNNPLDKNLEFLYLRGLNPVRILVESPTDDVVCPPLHSLLELTIQECGGFTHVTWAGQLPCLQMIFLSGCSDLEKVESADGKIPSFPNLRRMHLKQLPKLSSISNMILPPSLIREVSECPGLESSCSKKTT